MILGLIDEAVASGARQSKACKVIGLSLRTLQRWREKDIGEDGRAGPKHAPKNKLSARERAEIVRVANLPEYRDSSPKQIVPMLADQGIYLGSESSFYRALHAKNQMKDRGSAKPATKRHRPTEYVATGPNQVWSWDITYMGSPVRGVFFYFYVVMDVWSRKIVGWTVQASESAVHAQSMIDEACKREAVPRDQLVIHSDNGGPMKAATLLAFLQSIGVVPSFSRPSVSNDNPYSESLFRTAKYRPEYPRKPFASLEVARAWATWFVDWYEWATHYYSSSCCWWERDYALPGCRPRPFDASLECLNGFLHFWTFKVCDFDDPRNPVAEVLGWKDAVLHQVAYLSPADAQAFDGAAEGDDLGTHSGVEGRDVVLVAERADAGACPAIAMTSAMA